MAEITDPNARILILVLQDPYFDSRMQLRVRGTTNVQQMINAYAARRGVSAGACCSV